MSTGDTNRHSLLPAFPGWLVPAVAALLWLVALFILFRPAHREEDIVVRTFTERADTVIWALEAGARTWMGSQGDNATLSQLVRETAAQPGIRYIRVIDEQGEVLSQSDESEMEEGFLSTLPGKWTDAGKSPVTRVRDDVSPPVFEVRRQFVPVERDHHAFNNYRRHGHGMGMGMGRGHGMMMGPGGGRGRMGRARPGMMMPPQPEAEQRTSFVFVGMDFAPVASARASDSHTRLLVSLIAALLAAGGVLVLLWQRSHLRSRRLLSDARGELERGRRLTALGNLAAGIAHEIRNPLSSIKGLATYLSHHVPDGAPADAALTMIGEADRLNRVVSGLLDFAKPGAMKRSVNDVNEIIRSALRLADADIRGRHIAVVNTPSAALAAVSCNRERLTQALLNLFLNAVQAMGEGGTLTVTAEARQGGKRFAITVRDTGHGITDEAKAALFTPYYTTKAAGTGLGLSIVEQIIEGHGGVISVESSPGHGSAFTLEIPAVPPDGAGGENAL